MRLIDADALYRFCNEQIDKETGAYTRGKNKALNIVKSALHNECAMPTIDAVPVVRCEHCKHSILDDEFRILSCSQPLGGLGSTIVRPYDFCSYGERREDEQ